MPPRNRRSASRAMAKPGRKTAVTSVNRNKEPLAIVSTTRQDDPLTTKFPVEITVLIFQCYLRSRRKMGDLADDATFGFDEIPAGAPLHLGAVCRAWREIAWGTPALWTSLVVDLMSKAHAHGPALVAEWLQRTADSPFLNVALRLHTDVDRRHQSKSLALKGQRKRDAEAIVEIINQYSCRLQSIDLRDVPWDLATRFNSDAPSALENLCIGGYGNDSLSPDTHRRLFRETLHRHSPKTLSLLSSISPILLNISWSKITTLHIDNITREAVFDAIALCSSTLTTLSLMAISDEAEDEFDVDDDDWSPGRVFHLPALFAISYMEMGSQEGFSEILFNHITAPGLRSLLYFGMEQDNDMPTEAIISFIGRSACKIHNFVLQHPSIAYTTSETDDDGYMDVLRAMPYLRLLDISFGRELSIEPLLVALGGREPETNYPTFLPRLKTLDCTVYPTFEWALFPEVWMDARRDGLRLGDAGFKLSEIRIPYARGRLSADLTLRGPLRDEDLMDFDTVMALISVKDQVDSDIEIGVDSEGKRSLRGLKFMEKSFLHSFSEQTELKLDGMYEVFKEFF